MNPYPILTKLSSGIFTVQRTEDGGMRVWTTDDFGSTSTDFTTAELLELADELKAMVAEAQKEPT